MFFMIGITDGRKDIDFNQAITCSVCGKFGRFQIFMTYMSLSLFFIPVFKWNRKFYVQTTCCNTIYELDPETAGRIMAGENVEITEKDLYMVQSGEGRQWKRCDNCGYSTNEDFEYCPKCGHRF